MHSVLALSLLLPLAGKPDFTPRPKGGVVLDETGLKVPFINYDINTHFGCETGGADYDMRIGYALAYCQTPQYMNGCEGKCTLLEPFTGWCPTNQEDGLADDQITSSCSSGSCNVSIRVYCDDLGAIDSLLRISVHDPDRSPPTTTTYTVNGACPDGGGWTTPFSFSLNTGTKEIAVTVAEAECTPDFYLHGETANFTLQLFEGTSQHHVQPYQPPFP